MRKNRHLFNLAVGVALVESANAATWTGITGTDTETQSNINQSVTGDFVIIPAVNVGWTNGISITNKAIKLAGFGASKILGESTTTLTVQTGTVTLQTEFGLPITVGQVLKVERTGTAVSGGVTTGVRIYMIGTVTSYSGVNLVLNVTNTAGTGTHTVWQISTIGATRITKWTAGNLITVNESTAAHVDLSGFDVLFGAGGAGDAQVIINFVTNGQAVLVHDSYFESENTDTGNCIFCNDSQGVVWNCTFAAFPFSQSPLAIHLKNCPASWGAKSFFGTNDISGTNNFYAENCYFSAWLNFADFDDNARGVVRYSTFNNAGTGTHGADTSNIGVRHYQFYHNTGIFNGFSNGQTLNMNWWFFLRGGTGLFHDNYLPLISSGDYSTKQSYSMTVMNLQRNAGPHPCWGLGTTNGADYFAPRQVGFGNVTGASTNDAFAYVGDSEPVHIWNNAGTGATGWGWTDYGHSSDDSCVGNTDASANYIVIGRDVLTTAPANYQDFTYPHPLTGLPPIRPLVTSILVIGNVTFNGNITCR